MPNPNVDFTTGQTLLASQQNRFPRGIMAQAQSTVNYALTVANNIATGMTVSFNGVAGRLYKFTYYEPAVETSTVAAGSATTLNIRQTNAAGTQATSGLILSQVAGQKDINALTLVVILPIVTTAAYTFVGCAFANSVVGAPVLARNANAPALLLVEDIGLV